MKRTVANNILVIACLAAGSWLGRAADPPPDFYFWRLGQSLPAARWWPRLTEEARVGRVTIARQAPTPEGGR